MSDQKLQKQRKELEKALYRKYVVLACISFVSVSLIIYFNASGSIWLLALLITMAVWYTWAGKQSKELGRIRKEMRTNPSS
ncbi:MAG: hypothetical protein OK452_08960 [Thaumarchaeota archaeon]|nr:hypothetical protein [Nitrososphaerota archaeon]